MALFAGYVGWFYDRPPIPDPDDPDDGEPEGHNVEPVSDKDWPRVAVVLEDVQPGETTVLVCFGGSEPSNQREKHHYLIRNGSCRAINRDTYILGKMKRIIPCSWHDWDSHRNGRCCKLKGHKIADLKDMVQAYDKENPKNPPPPPSR